MAKCKKCGEEKSKSGNCNNCRRQIKLPEDPPIGCSKLIVQGKKKGQYCNETILNDNLCKKHLTNKKKLEKIDDKCQKKIKSGGFCNKELLENSEYCEEHTRNCTTCNKKLIKCNYEYGRKVCHVCRRKEQSGESSKINICNICKKQEPEVKFDSQYRGKCNKCRYSETLKVIRITKEEYLQTHENEIRKCLLCEEEKIITHFGWHTNNFRNQCKECISDFKHYIEWRIKKRLQDPIEFKKNNAKIAYKWRKDNPEYIKYVKVYTNSKEGITSIYLSSAKAKNLLTINEDDFKNMIEVLIIQDCFYCGKTTKEGNLQERIIGDYNGVDRINSNETYILENCVPCCKKCNIMKNTLDIASFLRKNVEISLYNNLNDNIDKPFEKRLEYHNKIKLIGNSNNYSNYKSCSKERKKEFNLTKEQFNKIVKQNCYLCGGNNSKGIGIDRFNNDIGYTLDNCKPCCSYCNFMKKNIDYNDFLIQVKNIVDYSTTEKHYSLCEISQLTRALNNNYYLEENEKDDIFDYLN